MKAHIGSQISGLLSSEQRSELSRAMLDVLRVLVVNRGTSWRSELVQDLALLRAFKGESEAVDKEELDKALKRLEENELVKTEDRIRGDLGARGEVKDVLIWLTDFVATQAALSKDRTLSSYMCEMSKVL